MLRRVFLKKTGRASVGASLFPLAIYAQRDVDAWDHMVADIERQLPRLLMEAAVPGGSIAVIRDAKLFWRRGFGVANATSGRRVDPDTVFEAASMSKPVFAYLVMKLCEKGVLDLDIPLTKYTPERYISNDPRLDLITARRILSHTSGFQDWRSTKDPIGIHFTPGEKFMYSGEGYSYLQLVVTRLIGHVNQNDCAKYEAGLRVCGTDFDTYMKTNLLVPFDMKSSGYLWPPDFNRRRALPHDSKGKPIPKSEPTPPDVARYGAAGGLLTTPSDYARFMIQIMAPGRVDAFHLSRASVKQMIQPQVKVSDMPLPVSWALGWRILHAKNGDIVSHDGGDSGFRTFGGMSVARKSGFVIMTNGNNGGTVINKLLYGEMLQPTGVALPELASSQ